MKAYKIFLRNEVVTELKHLLNTDEIDVSRILQKSLQRYIDKLESDESHIVLDGIKYPKEWIP